MVRGRVRFVFFVLKANQPNLTMVGRDTELRSIIFRLWECRTAGATVKLHHSSQEFLSAGLHVNTINILPYNLFSNP